MKDKRARHNKPHKTDRKGYHGKRKEWEEEDAMLAAEGKENPWDQFPGRSRPYLRARVEKRKITSEEGSGDITFSNPEVVGVADKVKRLAAESSNGSFPGVRENDILTVALENPEHRGRVRGVSSSVGWGKGFGEEFAGMYRKKRNKRSDADKEKIVGEAVSRVIHMLRQAGVAIPDGLGLTQAPHLSSSSEREGAHEMEGEGSAHVSEKQARVNEGASLETDTIDQLKEPTKCSLLDGSGHNMELALAIVYPHQEICHTVPVQFGCAVVQPTYVWPNVTHMHLPIPVGDEITTLGEALMQRIQWSRFRILIPPRTRNPNSVGGTSASRGTASDAGTGAQCQQKQPQQQPQELPQQQPQEQREVKQTTPQQQQ